MADSSDPTTQLTHDDIEIGARVARALLHHVGKHGGQPIALADLLELARSLDPKDAALGRAEVLGIAAKLRFVAQFCAASGYPNLAALAVHPLSLRPLPEYAGNEEAVRGAVAAFDWSPLPAQLADYVRGARAGVPPRLKPRKERPAEVSWYAYFCAHREACRHITSADKKELINLMMAGLDPETALRRLLAAKAAFADMETPAA